MTSVARSFGVALVAVASVVVVEAASAATAIQKCEVAKLTAASKEVRAKMACYVKAKKTAAPVDSTCLTHAQTNADTTINTADGACAGTASDIDAAIDSCLSAFLTDDPGNGACPARSAKAIGNGAKGELACQAKEVTTPGTFPTCDTREDGKTTARLGGAGGGTPCVNVTSVMTDIDNCDTAISAVLTTTTTTTIPFPTCSEYFSFCGSSPPPDCSCLPDVATTTFDCSTAPCYCGRLSTGPCGSDGDCAPGQRCIIGEQTFCVDPCP